MGRRIDHIDDPNAPEPNSLVPSVNAIVTNEQGALLLIRRTDSGNWALPGGALELGETVRQAAVRETKEETGIDCEITSVAGIYSNPRHLVEYTSDGEVRQEFTIVMVGHPIAGKPTTNDEASEVEWVDPHELEDLQMTSVMRARIQNHLSATGLYLD